MSWSGSGVFTRLHSWVSDRDAGYDILASRMDEDTDDIAQGLMHCLTVTGETQPVANIPMNNFRITGASPGVNGGDYVTVSQIISGGGGLPAGGYMPLNGGTISGPLTVTGLFHTNGDATIGGNLSAGSLNTGGGITGAAVHSTGGIQCDGNMTVAGAFSGAGVTATGLQVNGNEAVTGGLTVGGSLSAGGAIGAAGQVSGGSLYTTGGLQVTGGAGANISASLGVGGGITADSLYTSHDVQCNGNMSAALSMSATTYYGNWNGGSVLQGATVYNGLQVRDSRLMVISGDSPSVAVSNTVDGDTYGMWAASSRMYFGPCDGNGRGVAPLLEVYSAGAIYAHTGLYPNADNTWNCGQSGASWASVYAYNHITSSDPLDKTDIEAVPEGCLELVRRIEPKRYRWVSDDTGRVNWGFVAPEIVEAMDGAGLEFGGVFDLPDGKRALAYDQMIAVLWGAVRELAAELP